jgi:hypothetical protein
VEVVAAPAVTTAAGQKVIIQYSFNWSKDATPGNVIAAIYRDGILLSGATNQSSVGNDNGIVSQVFEDSGMSAAPHVYSVRASCGAGQANGSNSTIVIMRVAV